MSAPALHVVVPLADITPRPGERIECVPLTDAQHRRVLALNAAIDKLEGKPGHSAACRRLDAYCLPIIQGHGVGGRVRILDIRSHTHTNTNADLDSGERSVSTATTHALILGVAEPSYAPAVANGVVC